MRKPVSATAFRLWLKRMGFNHSKAARELGVSRSSIIKWSRVGASKVVGLACQLLELQK